MLGSASSHTRLRSPTPPDSNPPLKAIRYDDVADALPPRTSPPSSARPETANLKAPEPAGDLKRDSGFEPSFSTPPRSSSAETNAAAAQTNGSAVKELALPAILVEKDHAADAPSDAPRTRFEDLNLEDLVSDQIAFSQRGSLLYAGKKMNKRPEALNVEDEPASAAADTPSVVVDESHTQGEAAAKAPESNGDMLSPDVSGSRVMSMEEMTFSMRVRSMYEHGDEEAAKWSPQPPSTIDAESFTTANSNPELSPNSIHVHKPGSSNGRSSSLPVRTSKLLEPNERAGGLEDWEDVDGRDVDRYGFIKPKRSSIRVSNGDRVVSDGGQRIATNLQVPSQRPKRHGGLGRVVSSAPRSSRSVSGANGTADPTTRSIHSVHTHRSVANAPAGNPFRSRDKRAVAEASDMLTLPPGLAELAEEREASHTASVFRKRERLRDEKWQKMAKVKQQRMRSTGKGGGMQFEFDTTDPKVISRTWKGIPDRWRATAWHSFLSTSARKRGIGASDAELMMYFHKLQEVGSADDVQIDLDVPRTISQHVMFRRRYRGGQRLLFRVLHAISLYFPDTGYVQGMASLATTLLCYFDEENAFVMMVRMWQLRGLEQLFESGFGGLMQALEHFERDWLRDGDVGKQLEALGISSTAYGTRWYLTLFNLSIPFPAQLRVWDVFMLLGDAESPVQQKLVKKDEKEFGGADLDVLHATSAALIDATREILLDSDFEGAMKVLTSFVPVKDEDLLMRVARVEWKLRKKRVAAGKR